jgi:hypothetical protein
MIPWRERQQRVLRSLLELLNVFQPKTLPLACGWKVPLIAETGAREKQVNAFARFDEIMEVGRAQPSTRAADVVLCLSIL